MLETLAGHLNALAAIAPTWGLVLVFVFMAVESSFIPFPSEVVMIPAGFLAARGELGIPPVPALAAAILTGVLGSLLGAFANYFLALRVGKPFLRKYGKWFFVKPEPLDRACEVFNRYGAATTFVCRLIPVIRQLISIPAGISRMPVGAFALFTGLGAGVWSAILAAVGFWLGRTSGDISYTELVLRGKAFVTHNLHWVILGAAALVAAHFLLTRLVMRKRSDAAHG